MMEDMVEGFHLAGYTEAQRMSSLSRDQMKGGVGDIRSAEERADSSSGCRDSSASLVAFWALYLL